MKDIFIESVGLIAPGLAGWSEGAAVLRGDAAYVATELPAYAPALLPPNERRRATATVRLAFRVAEDAIATSRYKPEKLATVFSSSEADTPVMHRICSALAEPQRMISPTDFHNSVHNAAAGYWSIAAGCRAPSISFSAWDGGFVAGLLEAVALAHGDDLDVLLAVYDIPLPEPLHQKRPLHSVFGVALVLTTTACGVRLQLAPDNYAEESVMSDAALESLRLGNPAARSLPLLQQLAQRRDGAVFLPGVGTTRWRLTTSSA